MSNPKRHYRRSHGRYRREARGRSGNGLYENPRIDRLLKNHFQRIGIPEPAPFIPDPFQLEALKKIKESDVLVSAPTGAGKTWIASQVIGEYLIKGLRTWYASPLKALSNSLYQEFKRDFGPEYCGILTGERKENSNAHIIVGTTEILRNQLYDAMHEGTSINTDLVILDEAHYLSDPDRGVVWEEVLIYLPSRVRILLLSATISNAEEVSSWLERNRGTRTCIVRSNERPVPLEMLFLFPDGLIAPLAGRKGLTSRVQKYLASQRNQARKRGRPKPRFGDIIGCLREFDLLPAIFFLKSRMECDRALLTCPVSKKEGGSGRGLRREVEDFIRDYPHLAGHRQMGFLLDSRVASHHAGQLPYWKVLVERIMNKGYLDAIFSTSTVAAGVNFPARTVVLVQSDRYDGHEFTDLTSTDLHQMIGRAGRRGKDNIGFALVVPGLHQDPQLIHELMDSPPEPLISQIRINFSMTLNLLLSQRPQEIKELLSLSFADFQQRREGSTIIRQWDGMLSLLRSKIPRARCDNGDPFEIVDYIRMRSELVRAARGNGRRIQYKKQTEALIPYLERGRLFNHREGDVYILFHTYKDHGRLVCAAQNVKRKVRTRKGQLRLKKVPLYKVRWLYDYKLILPSDMSLESLQDVLDSLETDDLPILDTGVAGGPAEGGGLEAAEEKIDRLPCAGCDHLDYCHTSRGRELVRILRDLQSLGERMGGGGEGLWISFKRHLRFLKETNFADEEDRLTPDGIWASKLRLDQPLIIAEAIRKGGFEGLSPETMAGCIALFVWDRDQDVELNLKGSEDIAPMEEAFNGVIDTINDIRDLKARRGFQIPLIPFWPAIALFLWAKGVSWEGLLSRVSISEGDMASIIVRTADHLRQVVNLRDSHPAIARTAALAIGLILREPVYLE